jgi:hypothetical protein
MSIEEITCPPRLPSVIAHAVRASDGKAVASWATLRLDEPRLQVDADLFRQADSGRVCGRSQS